ncbi:MAG: IS4 family transposase, partial [Motiliproteus sp.]
NLIRTNIAQAAHRHRQLPRLLSVKATIQLLDETVRRGMHLIKQSVETYGVCLLKAIASTKIGKRKRMPQPRAIKQRPKAYPLLKEPREIACQKLIKTGR